MQLILGVLLEIVHNWKRTAIVYFASVLGGSLFITVLRPQIYVVGGSAAVYGLLFSHLSTILLNWNEIRGKFCRFFWLFFYVFFDASFSLYLEIAAKAYINVISTHLWFSKRFNQKVFFLFLTRLVIQVILKVALVDFCSRFWCWKMYKFMRGKTKWNK